MLRCLINRGAEDKKRRKKNLCSHHFVHFLIGLFTVADDYFRPWIGKLLLVTSY